MLASSRQLAASSDVLPRIIEPPRSLPNQNVSIVRRV
jgi:hypothetical protein